MKVTFRPASQRHNNKKFITNHITTSFGSQEKPEIILKKPSINNLKANFLSKTSFNGKILKQDYREWIEANGGGAYASSTVSGANTRVYHGLLITSQNQPVDRNVVLQRIDEEVESQGQEKMTLSENIFGNNNKSKISEESNILSFSVLPVPTWQYDLGKDKILTKQVVMPHNKSKGVVVVGYTYNAPEYSPPIKLTLRPIVNNRSFHINNNSVSNWESNFTENKIICESTLSDSPDKNKLILTWNNKNTKYEPSSAIYGNYFYPRESERGLGATENNVYKPGNIIVTLKPGESFSLTSSVENNIDTININDAVTEKGKYLNTLYNKSELPKTDTFKLLQRAADQFVVHRNSVNGPTVLAGYHWFNDWGRDTMISLPGCTLTTKRFDEAKGILKTFSQYARNGMLPNNFPDFEGSDPGYNTIDASMWWFNALDSYINASKSSINDKFVRDQYKSLQQVIEHHIYGRKSGEELIKANPKLENILDKSQTQQPVGNGDKGIGMEPDGLISADNGQLTWMDACKDENHPYTPREGKAVEINALWYNGLRIMQGLAEKFGETNNAEKYKKLADITKESMKKFWNPDTKCLYDLIDVKRGPYTTDGSIRPNQIIALSLPNRPFDDMPYIEHSTLNVVEEKLLTPYGLRSLAPGSNKYAPWYPNAGPGERDPVYHQGTVWGWLIGPFADAYLNVNGNRKETKEQVYKLIEPMLEHLKGNVKEHTQSGCCIGGIAEIFDATEPYYSKGTVNQAWSVAEVLRILDKVKEVIKEKEQ